MMITLNKTHYRAFGFRISSDFHLPELQELKGCDNQVDIEIQNTDLTKLWSELSISNNLFIVKKDFVMFHLPGTAIFLIEQGKRILVSSTDASKQDEIRLYILGTCMGAVLLQRKILPLHGSVISIDNKAYAIVGDCGAGKSTLARAFLKRGYKLISDDIIPIKFTEEGIPVVIPTYPHQKLWIESLNEFAMDSDQYKPIVDREKKFAIPLSNQFESEMLPLAGVFSLSRDHVKEVEMLEMNKLEQLHILFIHTYRNLLIEGLGLLEWHLKTTAKLSGHLTIHQLKRPDTRFTAFELTEIIMSTINKGVNDHE